MSKKQPLLISVAGGVASGKTTIVTKLKEVFNDKRIILLDMEDYFNDFSYLSESEWNSVNLDHPSALDIELFIANLKKILKNYPIEKPVFDLNTGARSLKMEIFDPIDIIIIDSTLALHNPEIRALSDIKIYVDADDDTRLLRILAQDLAYSKTRIENTMQQYSTILKPIHKIFVEPTKEHADIVIPSNQNNRAGIDLITAQINAILKQKQVINEQIKTRPVI